MKNETYLIDVDGVIFEHLEAGPMEQWFNPCPVVLPGVHVALDKLEMDGACIVLCSARKEPCRPILEAQLANAGILYDQLIMNLTSGRRVLINDTKPDDTHSVLAIEVPRNEGLVSLL